MPAPARSNDNRREPRISVECRATARIALSVEILDASPSGVRARVSLPLPVGTVLKIGLPGGTERHARVAWAEDGLVGCEFMAPLDADHLRKLLSGAGRMSAHAAA